MSQSNESSSTSIGFFGILTLIFITLKLTNYIAWSWWLVLLPFYGPLLLVFGFLIILWTVT